MWRNGHAVERLRNLIRHRRLTDDETLHQPGANAEARSRDFHTAKLAHQPRNHFLPELRFSHSDNIAERLYGSSENSCQGNPEGLARCPRRLRFALPAAHGRRVPRRLQAHHAGEVRDLPLVLPAPGCRPDRSARRADPPAREAPRPTGGRHGTRVLPHRRRPVPEGRDRQHPRGRNRRRGLRRSRAALVARAPDRDLRVCRPDLCRLRRLHGHRDRDRAPPRLHVPAELQLARTRRPRSRTSGGAGT